MFKKQLSFKANTTHSIASLFLMYIFFISPDAAQTSAITGKVSSDRWPVRAALVTFIDTADTTLKYSALTDDMGNYQVNVPTALEHGNTNIPAEFELAQNYPNPFNSLTAIPYSLRERSDINVKIYDILGRVVKEFTVGSRTAGSYRLFWDGRNSLGQRVANGIYLYRLQAGGKSQVKKMILSSGENSVIPLEKPYLSPEFPLNLNMSKSGDTESYSVRIENSNNTSPVIIAQQFDNIPIKNDTTINFNVSHLISVTVNLDSVHQYIRGFGAANILQWRPDMTDSEIETAFGTGEGRLGFTILRLRIQPQKDLWYTNVSTAKKAHDRGVLIFASPWNAPAEMLETVAGQRRVRHDMYDAYAAHLDSFNTYMRNNGVPLYAISVQNEPDFAQDWTGWTPEEMLTFMRENAQEVGTKVMAPESFQFRREMSDPLLNDSTACANLDIVGGHIYGGGLAPYPLAEEKGKEIWMTEHLSGENNSANDWSWAFAVAKEMYDVMQVGMSAYVWWYIVRYYGPIFDGEPPGGSKGEITKKGYVMSQYSKFIRPGDQRVESGIFPPLSNVLVTAYTDSLSSRITIVAVNLNSSVKEIAFSIQNSTMNTYTTYTTTQFEDVTPGDVIDVDDNRVLFSLKESSVTTFVLKK